MTSSPDKEWRTYLLEEMRELRREQAEARAENSAQNQEIREVVTGLRVDIEALKEKSRLWGSIFGVGGGIAATIITKLIKHT